MVTRVPGRRAGLTRATRCRSSSPGPRAGPRRWAPWAGPSPALALRALPGPVAALGQGTTHWGRRIAYPNDLLPTLMRGRARWARRLVGSATGRTGPVPSMRWPRALARGRCLIRVVGVRCGRGPRQRSRYGRFRARLRHWGREPPIGVGNSPTPMTCCLPRCGGRARWARRLVGSATGRKGPVPPMRWPVPWRARSGFLPCSDSGNRRGPSRLPCSRRGWPPGARGLPASGRRRAPAGRWGRVAA